jgi:hypothetical protein
MTTGSSEIVDQLHQRPSECRGCAWKIFTLFAKKIKMNESKPLIWVLFF